MLLALLAVVQALPLDWIPFNTAKYALNTTLPLAQNRSIQLFWSYNTTHVEFGVASQNGNGWVGIGTSDSGGMKGANIFLYNDGKLKDMFAETYATPSVVSDSSTLLANYTSTQVTAFTFVTPLARGLSITRPVWFIYAFGPGPTFSKHADENRAQKLVDLTGSYFNNVVVPTENTTTLKMISSLRVIAAEKTSYCYSLHDVTSIVDGKVQIVAEDYQVGTDLLHHIVVYKCVLKPVLPSETVCNYYREGSPDVINWDNTCREYSYFIWAKGALPKLYAKDVGKPLNTEYHQYFILERHYNNPNLLSNVTDPGSGFVFSITNQLRKYDVGMLTLGAPIASIKIPADSVYSGISECGQACTKDQNVIPSSGLTIISNSPHMHRYGKAMSTRIVRDGKDIGGLTPVDYYDFEFQTELFPAISASKILPGDRLITNCTWDNRGNPNPVRGGHSSSEEMCFQFVEYYPAVPMPMCLKSMNSNGFFCDIPATPKATPVWYFKINTGILTPLGAIFLLYVRRNGNGKSITPSDLNPEPRIIGLRVSTILIIYNTVFGCLDLYWFVIGVYWGDVTSQLFSALIYISSVLILVTIGIEFKYGFLASFILLFISLMVIMIKNLVSLNFFSAFIDDQTVLPMAYTLTVIVQILSVFQFPMVWMHFRYLNKSKRI